MPPMNADPKGAVLIFKVRAAMDFDRLIRQFETGTCRQDIRVSGTGKR